MPDRSENIEQLVNVLKTWSGELPTQVSEVLTANADVTTQAGERHGSWFLELVWRDAGLVKLAAIALTNPTPTPDDAAGVAIVAAAAGATDGERFVEEMLTETRRTLRRLPQEQLVTWLVDAVQHAAVYSAASLTRTYETPLRRG